VVMLLSGQKRTHQLQGGGRWAQDREGPKVTTTVHTVNMRLSQHRLEVPKPEPNFIYTHLKAHDLGLNNRSQGRGG
jgi:hypothetical protein